MRFFNQGKVVAGLLGLAVVCSGLVTAQVTSPPPTSPPTSPTNTFNPAPIILLLLDESDRAMDDVLNAASGSINSSLNVLSNDDNSPSVTLVSFGGPAESNVGDTAIGSSTTTASGAQVTLAANGLLTYDATGVAAATTGSDTLFYAVRNNGVVESAQITINFGEAPTALDDLAISASFNSPLNVAASAGLLSNDSLGTPGGSLLSFGGGDLGGLVTSNAANASLAFTAAGGTLQVNADGSFSLTDQPFTTGSFTFDYRLSNSFGSSDATVAITIDDLPVANDDEFSFSFDTDQATPASLFNDNGNGADNLSTLNATIASFGGGSLGGAITDNTAGTSIALAGGTLTINSDGTWSLTGQPFTTGQFTVDYRLDNGSDTSDATITFNITQLPVAVDDGPTPASAPGDNFHGALNTPNAVANGAAGDLDLNDTLGSPVATIDRFGAIQFNDGLGVLAAASGVVTDNVAGSTLNFSSLSVSGITDGSLTVSADGSYTLVPPSDYTGLLSFEYRLSNSAGSDTAAVTLAVGTRPQCVDDAAYAGSVNVPISVVDGANDVLGNDTGDQIRVVGVQSASGSVGTSVAGNSAGSSGSTNLVVLNQNGSFTHSPAAGLAGANTFSYTAGNGFGAVASPCLVTVTTAQVAGTSAWFIDQSASGSANTGTFDNPFTSIDSFNTQNAAGVNQPGDDDVIYLDPDGSYNETDGINLRDGQNLIGGTVQFGSAYAANAGGGASLAPLYASFAATAEGTRSVIASTAGDAIDLAQNNSANGIDIGDTPDGFGLDGTAVGAPNISNMDISGTGGAIRIATSGDLSNVALGQVSSSSSIAENILLTGATGDLTFGSGGLGLSGSAASSAAMHIDGGSVGFTYADTINKDTLGSLVTVESSTGGDKTLSGNLSSTGAALGLLVQNNTGGTVDFSGTTKAINTATNTGVTLSNNSGATINFSNGGLDITTTTGTGFDVSNSGTVAVTGAANNINTGSGRTVVFDSTLVGAAGLNFATVGNTAAGISAAFDTNNLDGGDVVIAATNLTGSGVRLAGTTNANINFGDMDIVLSAASQTGVDLLNTVLDSAVTVSASDFDLTSSSTSATVGIRLVNATGTGNLILGDATTAGDSSTVTGVDQGLLFDANTNINFTFGDSEDTVDGLSSITATTAIAGALPSNGNYNLRDVGTLTGNTAALGGPTIFWVDQAQSSVNVGSTAVLAGSIVNAEAANADVIALVDTNVNGASDTVDVEAGSPNTLNLDDGQILVSFAAGDSPIDITTLGFSGSVGAPSNFDFNTALGISGSSVINAPPGIDTVHASLSSSGQATVTLAGSAGIGNVNFASVSGNPSILGNFALNETITLDRGAVAGVRLMPSGGTTMLNANNIGFTSTVNLDGSGGGAIVLNTTGVNTIATMSEQILNLNDVALNANGVSFASLSSASPIATGDAIRLNAVSGGVFSSGAVAIAGTGADGINIENSAITFNFNGLTDIDNVGARGVDLRGSNGSVTFANVDIDNSVLSDFSVTNNTNTVIVTAGTIDSPSAANGGVSLNGGAADVTIGANVTNVNGLAVQVANRTSGTVTFNGSVSSSGAGATGVSIQDNSVSLIDFNGQLDVDNQGVSLTNNTVGSEVRFDGGLDINSGTDTALILTNSGTVTVANAATETISTSSGTAINIDSTTVNAAFDNLSSSGLNGNKGIDINNHSGSLSIGGGAISNTGAGDAVEITGGFGSISIDSAINSTGATGLAVDISGRTGGTVDLSGNLSDDGAAGGGIMIMGNAGTLTLSGSSQVLNTATNGGVDINNNTGTINFTNGGLVINTTSGTGFNALNSNSVNVGGTGNTVTTTAGETINLSAVTTNATFASATATGLNGNKGIDINNHSGTFAVTVGTITNTGAGDAIEISGGAGSISIGTAVNSTGATGLAVDTTGRTGGSVNISGSLTDSNSTGGGINLTGNTAGTINIDGTGSKQINTATSNAVTVANSGSSIVNFTGGGLDIDTTSGIGLNATGGTLNITGPGNTVDSTTGTAVNINGATIGASGLTLQSVNSNGAVSGIVLNNTATGAFTLTGDGATTGARGGNGSGGTIQNSTGNGISLTNASNVNLNHMTITNSDINGIRGNNVSNFVLNRFTVNNNGDAVAEGGLRFGTTGGATGLLGNSAITNSVVTGSAEHNVRVTNSSGTLAQLLIDNSTISSNSATLGADGLLFEANGSTTATILASNSTFDGNLSDAIQVAAEDNSNVTFTATGNTLRNGARAITLSAGDNADLTFTINNNAEISGFSPNSGEEVINITALSTTTASSLLSGSITNNTNVTNSGGFVGIDTRGLGDLTLNISNNTATTSRQVIDGIFGDLGGPAGVGQNINLTILNNTLTATGLPSNVSNEGIALETGTSGPTVCMNISGNTSTASGTREGLAFLDSFPTSNPNITLEGVGVDAATILSATNTLNGGIFIEPAVGIVAAGTCLTP